MHQQSSDSPEAAVTAVLGASGSSSSLSMSIRKVRLSDQELFQRVHQVAVPNEFVDLSRLSSRRGWKYVKTGVPGGMRMCYRTLSSSQGLQCQVVVGGEIRARSSELVSLLRTPTENESNALLRALYGSRFIYSSLVHAIPNAGSMLSPLLRGSGNATSLSGSQIMVRTISFAHTKLPNPFKLRSSTAVIRSSSRTTSSSIHQQQASSGKNEQCCYIELLTATPDGFKVAFCSIDAADLTAGKAPPEYVIALHPISGWFTSHSTSQDSETIHITFQAAFLGEQLGGCDSRVAQARLLFIAKGICRLEKVLHRRRQPRSAPGRVWQALTTPFRAFGDDSSEGAHHNWHCIACTRSFLPTLRKRWRRCDLCAYRVCADPPCCSNERVAIYSRYVAPLLVCARCRECIHEHDNGNNRSAHRIGHGYAGLSLRFTAQENELEPEFELDPNDCQWGVIDNTTTDRRSSTSSRTKRRTQSDPPPVLEFVLSSSAEDNSLS